MHWKTNKRWAIIAATALLLSGGVGLGPSLAAAPRVAPPTFVSVVPAGYLDLQLRTSAPGVVSAQVLQYSAANPPVLVATQGFIITRCEVTGTTGPELLRISSSVGRLGIYNNGLGSKTKNNCIPAEGRTSAAETLTVGLGRAFAVSSLKIDVAQLDIEGKFSASLAWTLNSTSTPTSGSIALATSNDNGPDSGTGDNTMVTVGTKNVSTDDFTSMVLSTPVGEFGLDGGGDGIYPTQNLAGNNDSVFFLTSSASYPYTVGCGDIVNATSELSDSYTAADRSKVTELVFARLPNKDPLAPPCEAIGVTVSASDSPRLNGAFFDHSTMYASTGLPQSVRARVKIVWSVDMTGKSQTDIDLELSREVTFAADGAPVPVKNCLNVPAEVAASPLTSTAVIVHPANTPWCLLADSRVVSGSTIIQTQYYSGNGDPRIF